MIVGIEAATDCGGVALADAGGRLIAHTWRESRRPVSTRLLADLDDLLAGEGIPSTSLRAVAVSLGPGAFTGLRVGLALAKTLAQGWGVRLYGYSTLAAVARRWPVAGETVAVLLDARRSEVYTGIYRSTEDGAPAEVLREDRVEAVESFLEAVEGTSPGPLHLAGSGALVYRDLIARRLGDGVRWLPSPWDAPGADALALAGAHDWRAGSPGLDPLTAQPVYLRPSDAERRHGPVAFLTWSAV